VTYATREDWYFINYSIRRVRRAAVAKGMEEDDRGLERRMGRRTSH
jgi:hypothetical protein